VGRCAERPMTEYPLTEYPLTGHPLTEHRPSMDEIELELHRDSQTWLARLLNSAARPLAHRTRHRRSSLASAAR
jgi:hypothetical protein